MVEFGGALLRRPVEFWYDQFLAKPPEISSPTYWHQDEGYWGRNLWERGVPCWMPLHDVDESNGCMHFIDGGHRLGVLEHHPVEGVQSDLLTCDVDESRMVACPLRLGDELPPEVGADEQVRYIPVKIVTCISIRFGRRRRK